jgi:glycine/D-amino acid oxidase-like deaminating enzyme
MSLPSESTDIAVIGAGIVGIAVAWHLVVDHGVKDVVLVEAGDPMGLTSAQSGENYRNWWPHWIMRAFTDDSTTIMEKIARDSGNRIRMTRRGYALCTRRAKPDDLIEDLYRGYSAEGAHRIRLHEAGSTSYRPPVSADWETAPDGVDVLLDQGLIRAAFPHYSPDIAAVLHIRRAGDISGQQMGMLMLEAIRAAGGRVLRGTVQAIEGAAPFVLKLGDGATLRADRIVNAAGPYMGEIAAMHGETLPLQCVFQQKISFEDREGAVPRASPFSIDLDGQQIPWTDEEREILESDPATQRLLAPLPGGAHCRPEGGDGGKHIKIGWAYNRNPSDPRGEPPLDPQFPDTVLRGTSRLNPAMAKYVGRLPRGAHHYGGYYTMTPENMPLIGPMRTKRAFMAGALSGFGTMGACATGSLCAAYVMGAKVPDYAWTLGLGRYEDKALMAELNELNAKGIL